MVSYQLKQLMTNQKWFLCRLQEQLCSCDQHNHLRCERILAIKWDLNYTLLLEYGYVIKKG